MHQDDIVTTNKLNSAVRNIKKVSIVLSGVVLIACNGGGSSSSNNPPPPANGITNPVTPPTGNGYMTVQVSPAGVCSYQAANIPCVSVTICNASNTCTTVPDVILDTGSFGLRIFNQFVSSLNLPNITSDGSQVAECVYYGDNSSNWGPVVTANVQLATGITVNNLPIQIIDNDYPGAWTTPCANPSITPEEFRGNGIMGVGPLVYDNGSYFACNSESCSAISNPPDSIQVANPIARINNAEYNNGLTLKFPGISSSGASGAAGYAIFGIGTNADNSVEAGVNVYPSTGFNVPGGSIPIGMSVQYSPNSAITNGFLDTGSSFYYFTDNTISTCSDGMTYCPSSQLTLNPANQNVNGNYIAATVNIANANNLTATQNTAYDNYGVNLSTSFFDYGLPFFFNKTVYVGFKGESSSIGSGEYWAF